MTRLIVDDLTLVSLVSPCSLIKSVRAAINNLSERGLEFELSVVHRLDPASAKTLQIRAADTDLVITARLSDEIAGALMARQDGRVWTIEALKAGEAHRGIGVEEHLLAHFLRQASRQEATLLLNDVEDIKDFVAGFGFAEGRLYWL